MLQDRTMQASDREFTRCEHVLGTSFGSLSLKDAIVAAGVSESAIGLERSH